MMALGDLVYDLARGSTYGGWRIGTPRGGPPPPTLFFPAHGGRIALRGRTLGVCTPKKVSLLSLVAFLAFLAL